MQRVLQDLAREPAGRGDREQVDLPEAGVNGRQGLRYELQVEHVPLDRDVNERGRDDLSVHRLDNLPLVLSQHRLALVADGDSLVVTQPSLRCTDQRVDSLRQRL